MRLIRLCLSLAGLVCWHRVGASAGATSLCLLSRFCWEFLKCKYVELTPSFLLAVVYTVGRWGFRRRFLPPPPCLPRDSSPGSGRWVGEVFRVVEGEGDYLRLMGRGGDVYLAWDFVLGTLDSGEWVLFGEDGPYLAERRGGGGGRDFLPRLYLRRTRLSLRPLLPGGEVSAVGQKGVGEGRGDSKETWRRGRIC